MIFLLTSNILVFDIFQRQDTINLENKIFNTYDEEWAISEDNRIKYKYNHTNKTKKKIFKISFHYILSNKYTNSTEFFPYVKKMNSYFKEQGVEFDTAVYRKTLSKFRMIMCKKHNKDGSIEKKSLLKPLTFKKDLSKHLLQFVVECSKLDLGKTNEKIINNNINDSKNKQDIINSFDIHSTKEENGVKFYLLNGICPFYGEQHTSNHHYIVDTGEVVIHKCFSKNRDCCKNGIKILYKNIWERT